jgi:hypothetical protein
LFPPGAAHLAKGCAKSVGDPQKIALCMRGGATPEDSTSYMSTEQFAVLPKASRSEHNSVSSGGNNCSVTSADFKADDFIRLVQDGVVNAMLEQHSYAPLGRAAFKLLDHEPRSRSGS